MNEGWVVGARKLTRRARDLLRCFHTFDADAIIFAATTIVT